MNCVMNIALNAHNIKKKSVFSTTLLNYFKFAVRIPLLYIICADKHW